MKTNKRAGFTLVELIVVIAIIGLLAGVLLPALSSSRTTAKKTQARAEMDQIEVAWEAYLLEYRKFPDTVITEMGDDAIRILRGDVAENPLRIIFMDFQQNKAGAFRDPWGQVYHVELDVDGDDFVTVNGETLPMTVAVWSDGPDGQPKTSDDIHKWE